MCLASRTCTLLQFTSRVTGESITRALVVLLKTPSTRSTEFCGGLMNSVGLKGRSSGTMPSKM